MNTIRNLRACRHYATLLCAARITINLPACTSNIARAIMDMADVVYYRADPTIHSALDAIKRVMEIDDTVDQPGVVLMHAGIR